MSARYIGLMSGTSLDGIDAALVDFGDNAIRLVDFVYRPFSDTLKDALQRLSQAEALISLREFGSLDVELGHCFAEATRALLEQSGTPAASIRAIGSHGQTVYHAPDCHRPFTLQIGDPNVIAELTGITTIADFRRRDLAAGGQGAPLVPAFHQAVFGDGGLHRCIVNIGGIANMTVLSADASAPVIGFDTGPGNTLMDLWMLRHKQRRYDGGGAWAKSGTVCGPLLRQWLQDPYFKMPAPKSTGKEYFSLDWLTQYGDLNGYRPEDIQASLASLTALSIASAIEHYAPETEQVLVCGGGVHNDYLLALLKQHLRCPLASTEIGGIHPDHVEAMAFAWLARQTALGLPGNLKTVTGATRAVILGGVYPAC